MLFHHLVSNSFGSRTINASKTWWGFFVIEEKLVEAGCSQIVADTVSHLPQQFSPNSLSMAKIRNVAEIQRVSITSLKN
jgi:hypothetical protein